MSNNSSRRWCFTVNNWTPDDEETFQQLECTYLVYGREVGESGTPHLQGYVTFKSMKRMSALKKVHQTAHWEAAKGTSLQASDYCKKEGDYFEKGDTPSQGKRNDLLKIALAIKSGSSLKEVSDMAPDTYIRNYRGLANYAALQVEDFNAEDVRGIWLYGPPGKGKSHHARLFAEVIGGLYNKAQNKWWDGYNGEPVVLLDDMDSDALAHYLKIWTDKYACSGEIKGGTVKLRHKWFIVTSNEPIDLLFADKPEVMRQAIKRRFHVINVVERVDQLKALAALA